MTPVCCCQFPGLDIKDPTDPLVKQHVYHSSWPLLFLLQHSHSASLPLTPQPPPYKSKNSTILPERHLPCFPIWPDPFLPSHSATLRLKNSPERKISSNTWLGVQGISGPTSGKDDVGAHPVFRSHMWPHFLYGMTLSSSELMGNGPNNSPLRGCHAFNYYL